MELNVLIYHNLFISDLKIFFRIVPLGLKSYSETLMRLDQGHQAKNFSLKEEVDELLLWLSRLQTQLVSMRIWVQSLASLSGLMIGLCRKLQCRLQTQLRSGSSCSSDLTSSLGTSICHKHGHKKAKKGKKKRKR